MVIEREGGLWWGDACRVMWTRRRYYSGQLWVTFAKKSMQVCKAFLRGGL